MSWHCRRGAYATPYVQEQTDAVRGDTGECIEGEVPGLFLLRAPLDEPPGRESLCRHEATLSPLYVATRVASTDCGRCRGTHVAGAKIVFRPAKLLTWPPPVSIMRVVGCRYLQWKGILVSRTREPSR